MRFTIILFLFLTSVTLNAQKKTTKKVAITTHSGDKISGTILESDKDKMIIKTSYGTTEVPMKSIAKVSYKKDDSEKVAASSLGDNNYSASHYLFSPSGFGLDKGERYYENTYLFWNTFGIGLSKNFSLNIAGEIISPLYSEAPLTAITPKISLPMEGIGAFSLGATLYTYPNNGVQYAGSLNAAITFGNRQNNITINGYVGLGSDIDINELFPFSISTMCKVSDKLSFVSEIWVVSGESFSDDVEALISANLRYHFDDNKSSITFGLWRPTADTGPLIAIPFLSGMVGF